MKKHQQVCYQHPDRLTFRRCFFCQKPICSECSIIRSHHYFCSTWCWWRYGIARGVRLGKRILHGIKWRVSGGVVVLLLLGILLWFGWSLQKIHHTLDLLRLRSSLPSTVLERKRAVNGLKLVSPAESKGMVYRNRISIEGEADDNSVVMLIAGEKLLRAVQPHNEKFRFEGVKLHRGENRFLVQMVSPDGHRIALEELIFRYNLPTMRNLLRPFNRGSSSYPHISLTFDGGYLNNVSDEILDLLAQFHVKATFFLTGRFVQLFPETVKRIVADGHEVGNHTMNHPHLTTFAENGRHDTRPGLTRSVLQKELNQMAELFFSVTGRKVAPIWRAPYGEQNREIRTWAAELGYREVGWTVGNGENMDTMDWVADSSRPNYRTAEQIQEKILHFAEGTENAASGAIILMHLGSQRKNDFPHRRLPQIIQGFWEKGYQFVTISEMIQETFY